MGERVMHNGDPIPVGKTLSNVPDVQVRQLWLHSESPLSPGSRVLRVESINDGKVYFTCGSQWAIEDMIGINGWSLVKDDCKKAEELDESEAMRCVDDYLSRLPIEAQRRALIWLDAKWHERKKEREFDDCSLGATE